jgi:hypothetical protein
MDKYEAQRAGATDQAEGLPDRDRELYERGADIDVRIFYAHGYHKGHDRCDCPIMVGQSNINATVLVADGETAS